MRKPKYIVQVFDDNHAFSYSETKREAMKAFEDFRIKYPKSAIVCRGPNGKIAEQEATA